MQPKRWLMICLRPSTSNSRQPRCSGSQASAQRAKSGLQSAFNKNLVKNLGSGTLFRSPTQGIPWGPYRNPLKEPPYPHRNPVYPSIVHERRLLRAKTASTSVPQVLFGISGSGLFSAVEGLSLAFRVTRSSALRFGVLLFQGFGISLGTFEKLNAAKP